MEEGEGGTSRESRRMCTIMHKLASQWEAAAGHRELNLVLCGNQDGGRGGVGRRFRREGTYVYLRLICIVLWWRPTQYCKAITIN